MFSKGLQAQHYGLYWISDSNPPASFVFQPILPWAENQNSSPNIKNTWLSKEVASIVRLDSIGTIVQSNTVIRLDNEILRLSPIQLWSKEVRTKLEWWILRPLIKNLWPDVATTNWNAKKPNLFFFWKQSWRKNYWLLAVLSNKLYFVVGRTGL